MIIVSSKIPPEGSMKTERVELLLGSPLRDDGVRYSRNSVTVGPRKLGTGSVAVWIRMRVLLVQPFGCEELSELAPGIISNTDVGIDEGK